MHVSRRGVEEHRGRWVESVAVYSSRPDAPAPEPAPATRVVSECEIEFSDTDRPWLLHRTRLTRLVDLGSAMANTDATVQRPVPEALGEPVPSAGALLDEDGFWRIVTGGNGSRDLALSALRRKLARMPKSALPGFQARLIDLCQALVDRCGAEWADAGLAVILGPTRYAAILAGQRDVARLGELEFDDFTDVAEDVLGHRIDVTGYGDSRSGLGAASATTRSGRRWLAWRAIADSPDGLSEIFYFTRRPLGTSIAEATASAQRAIVEDGFEALSQLEVRIPDGIGHVPVPFAVPYVITGRPGADRDDYFSTYGLGE